MFGLFRGSKQKKSPKMHLLDIEGNTLQPGDKVMSYRYELGNCIILEGENGVEYESVSSKKRVNWTLMIDAATERQKVKKLEA